MRRNPIVRETVDLLFPAIVLFGLYLTYTTQHLKTIDANEIKKLKDELLEAETDEAVDRALKKISILCND